MAPIPKSLAEVLAAAEKKKYASIRDRLGIPAELKIDAFQLEAMSFHLGERSGAIELKLEGDTLRVSEPGRTGGGIPYRGDSVGFLLGVWKVSREEAQTGCVIELKDGKRRTGPKAV